MRHLLNKLKAKPLALPGSRLPAPGSRLLFYTTSVQRVKYLIITFPYIPPFSSSAGKAIVNGGGFILELGNPMASVKTNGSAVITFKSKGITNRSTKGLQLAQIECWRPFRRLHGLTGKISLFRFNVQKGGAVFADGFYRE
jgi:hypothetical protein